MYDVHVHITPKGIDTQYVNLSLEQYIKLAKNHGINHAYVFINPFIVGYTCPINHKHRVNIVEDTRKYYKIVCEECGETIYLGTDVYEEANFKLACECKTYSELNSYDVKPLAFLSAPYRNLNYLIDKYEEHDDFIGYKIHPTICKQYVSSLPKLNTRKPIIFHSGVGVYENPNDEIEYSKRHNGNVIIAHCCRFNRECLTKVKKLSNVWVDTSPFSFLWNQYHLKQEKLYIGDSIFESPLELFEYFIGIVGIEKVVFSSDAPFGDFEKEVEFFKEIGLSDREIEIIAQINPRKIFNGV